MSVTLPRPRHVLRWPDHRVEMAFRMIEPGRFLMGSHDGHYADEEPMHLVHITQEFWLAETPVTQAQFAIWTEAEDVKHENYFPGRPHNPAENMT